MPKKKYPPELEPFVREKFKTYTARQLAPIIKAEMGIDMTPAQVKAYTANHGIYYGRRGKKLPEARITTPEIEEFIQNHHKGTGPKEMTALVNAKFGTGYTVGQIKSFYRRNKLNSGLTGQFTKGQESWNKGKTWDEYMSKERQEASRKACYKKGHIPHNGGTPVGTVRLRRATKNKPGSHPYCFQKVAEPNQWRKKHVIEWEEHNGPVPEGSMVTFADGDTTNWHIENLVLETRAQHAVKNRFHIHGQDKETDETANAIADLKMAICAKKKRKEV